MTPPADGADVPRERTVLRAPVPPKEFVPGAWRPTHLDFTPGSADREDAERRKKPVRLSVWDSTLTAGAEVLEARRNSRARVVEGNVGAVIDAGARAVVYDTLEGDDAALAGAAGHAGIEGLDRPVGVARLVHSALLQKIADCFRLVE